MEPKQPKLPSEAVELYNLFIHGVISRRAFLDGIQKFAVGGLAAATIIEALMPNYAQGQQVSKTDDRIKATYETVPSPQGNGSIKGYFVRPVSADSRAEKPVKLPGIIVVHANRGLNPHIEDIARRFAHRFLLRRRHVKYIGRSPWSRFGCRCALLRRPSCQQGGRFKDQGCGFSPSWRTRQAAGRDVAGLRDGPKGGKCSARRLYLPWRCSRLQL